MGMLISFMLKPFEATIRKVAIEECKSILRDRSRNKLANFIELDSIFNHQPIAESNSETKRVDA